MVRAVVLEKLEAARARLTQAACVCKGNYSQPDLSESEERWVMEMATEASTQIQELLTTPNSTPKPTLSHPSATLQSKPKSTHPSSASTEPFQSEPE